MTTRGKVLLFVGVAFGLVLLLGVALQLGAARGQRIRELSLHAHEQRYLLSQLRGDALLYLNALNSAHASGSATAPIRAEYLRQTAERLSQLHDLVEEEEELAREAREEESGSLDQLEQALRAWADHTEALFRTPAQDSPPGLARLQEPLEEFGQSVEPLLVQALKQESNELELLDLTAEESLRVGRLTAILVPLASLGLLFALATAILVPMSRRLRELLAGTERIGRGELGYVLPERWRDEFGTVARGFNQMARALKSTQDRLVAADRLATVGQVAAGVGHEINNPLAYVLSNLSYIREGLRHAPGSLPEEEWQEMLEAAEGAHEGAERVRFIAQDLKSLSRSEETKTHPVDVGEVVRSAARMAAHELRDRARVVEDCVSAPRVQGNAARMGQVFLNLLINAAHAITPGRVEENEIRVTARASSPQSVTVAVSDTGCGIPSEHLDRIFEPFFTTKPPGVGTGLGLAVCRNIITSLGGSITVDSQPGRGTTFHITLPIAASSASD